MEIYEIHRENGSTSYTLGGGGPSWGYLEREDGAIFEWNQQWFEPKVFRRIYGDLNIDTSDEGFLFLTFTEINGDCARDCGRIGYSTSCAG